MRPCVRSLWIFALVLSALVACRRQSSPAVRPLFISAIPDQDPERLQRLYGSVAAYLARELGVPVVYKPVTDYTASVTAFKVGDLDLVWYGGLTGVQARLQVPGAHAVVQRDIDGEFHSVFIGHKGSGIQGLADLKGRSFTFGSESSTSGRLMPQYYLGQNGLQLKDFKGEPGFSGSHDKTISLVTAGTYEAGVLNEQVWKSRLAKGTVDREKVEVIWTSPAFHDYHWVVHPAVSERYGADFGGRLTAALTRLEPERPADKEILELLGARRFVPTEDGNYAQIEAIGRELGMIVTPAAGAR